MKKLLLPLALAATALSAHAAGIHSGLLSYWDFEGNFEDSAAGLAGNASTVDDNGSAGSAVSIGSGGPLGSFGNFSRSGLGTENVVAVSDSADVVAAGESLTISTWFTVNSFDQGWQGLIAHGEGSDYRIARRGTDSVMGYAGGTGDIPGSAIGADVTGGGWHHVVAISEAGVSTRIWIDGALVETGGVPTIADNGSGQLFIGGNPQGDGGSTDVNQYRPWNGSIDDVAMWNRALTDLEVAQIYTAGQNGIPLGAMIPEPSTGLLGLLGLALATRRRRQSD